MNDQSAVEEFNHFDHLADQEMEDLQVTRPSQVKDWI